MSLEGKTALVTGGSRGIGAAIVRRLRHEGATVYFTYRASEVDDPLAIRADHEDPASVAEMFAPVRDDGLDILVNNAAINPPMRIAELTAEEFDRVMTVNVKVPALAMREAAAVMRDGGRIINLSTLSTVVPAPAASLYITSKAALEGFTAVAAREFGGRGITVNTVSPGATDTDMLHASNSPQGLEQTVRLTSLQRLGRPEDIAAVVAYLAGPDAAWITGQNIRATGGLLV